MKIVVLDGYTLNPGDLTWERLEALGDLTVYDRTPEDKILQRIGDAEIVFTNKTPLTKTTFEKIQKVKWIGVLATGYNVVDITAAKEKGIPVTNIPTYGTKAVGQFAMALLLEICHHIGAHDSAVRNGQWGESSDFCFWNYPLFEENVGMINKENIAKMKQGVIILNTSRGPIVNEQELADALNSGKVGAAGLDVVSTEPIKENNPLLQAKKLYPYPSHCLGTERIERKIA